MEYKFGEKTLDRVYKGGHHEVFCDDINHLALIGSGFGTSPTSKEKVSFRFNQSKRNCRDFK